MRDGPDLGPQVLCARVNSGTAVRSPRAIQEGRRSDFEISTGQRPVVTLRDGVTERRKKQKETGDA